MMKKTAQAALVLFLALWLIGTPAWASASDWLVLAGHPFSPDAIAGLYGPALDLETGYAEGVAYAVAQYESERFHFYLDEDRGWVIEAVALTGPSARVTIGGAAVGMAWSDAHSALLAGGYSPLWDTSGEGVLYYTKADSSGETCLVALTLEDERIAEARGVWGAAADVELAGLSPQGPSAPDADWLDFAGFGYSPDYIAELFGQPQELVSGFAEGVGYAVAQYEGESFHFVLDDEYGWVIQAITLRGAPAHVSVGGAQAGMWEWDVFSALSSNGYTHVEGVLGESEPHTLYFQKRDPLGGAQCVVLVTVNQGAAVSIRGVWGDAAQQTLDALPG